MRTGIDDNWTVAFKAKIAACYSAIYKERATGSDRAFYADMLAYYKDEVDQHLARKAADPCNVIKLCYYQRERGL